MKILKGIISTLLAIIVIPMMMAFIVYLSTNTIISKKNINKFVKEASVNDFLIDEDGNYNEFGKEVRQELIDNGLPEEVVDEFINAKEITEFASEYAESAINYVVYGDELKEIKAEDISKLINDNVDTIVQDLRNKKVEGYEKLTDDKVDIFKSNTNEISKKIEESIPDVKEAIEESNIRESIKIVRFVFGKVVYLLLIGIILILLLGLLLLNSKRFGYLIWYGIIFMVSALPFIGIVEIARMSNVESNSKAFIDILQTIINKFSLYSNIVFIVGVIFCVLAIILRNIDRINNTNSTN